ncbi:MAG: DUF4012 domain-containing protein [Anaerolineae bacterium]|nr:DUF4012 domain-containing protein [Anaerolineae bacterium]
MKKKVFQWSIPACLLIICMVAIDLRIFSWGYNICEYIDTELSIIDRYKKLNNLPLAELPPDEILSLAQQSSETMKGLNSQLDPIYPILDSLYYFPIVGEYAAQVKPAVAYALALSNLAESTAVCAEYFSNNFVVSHNREQQIPELLFQTYLDIKPLLEQNREELAAVKTFRKELNPVLFPPAYQQDLTKLDESIATLENFQRYAVLIPKILGEERPQTYLILVQNHDELRASGGFITSFGLLRIDQGKITLLSFEDSTRLNYVDKALYPPEPVHKIMMAAYWVPRDGNWSPDFPTTARQVQSLYYSSTAYPTDGVIAFDQTFLVELLRFLGPVKLAGDLPKVSAENFESMMVGIKTTAAKTMGADQRKFFIASLAPVLLDNLKEVQSAEEIKQLAKLIETQIRQGSLQVYFNDPQIQRLLENQQLSGKLDAGRGDFLMLVDSNIGFSKNDSLIIRSIKYEVNLKNISAPLARVAFSHENRGVGTEPCNALHDGNHNDDYYFPRCYWDYWRVYLTPGSTINAINHPPVPPDFFKDEFRWENKIDQSIGEGGTTLVGGLTVVPQQEKRETSLEISLPASVISEDGKGNLFYLLRIQKQAGIDNVNFLIQITPPDGYTLKSSTIKGLDINNSITWQAYISRSGEIVFEFQPKTK